MDAKKLADLTSEAHRWLARDPDPKTRAEIEHLLESQQFVELQRRFETRLSFGTAGIRGVLGGGPNRMNRLVVRETTVGLGRHLIERIPDAVRRGVVVGFDGRRGSREFARDAAAVLAALGFKVLLADRELPTPVCAFAVLDRRAAGGVVITASHNPPEYNGYKVYWENGAQIIPPVDEEISARIDEAACSELPWMSPEEAAQQGRIVPLGEEIIDDYLRGLEHLRPRSDESERSKLVLAYTPLHGVGAYVAERALARAGFVHVHVVSSQRDPDPAFPTVRFPNPEEPGAMDSLLALARETQADLAFANDPDADRLAVAVRTARGTYRQLTGDELGILLGAWVLKLATERVIVATTIVSSRMLGVLAKNRGARYVETLTGFKWIANATLAVEHQEKIPFAYGYEEALGYAVGPLVRDKDGISAMVAFAELAAGCRRDGRTVLDELESLYRHYGLYVTSQKSLPFDPRAGGPALGDRLRARPPERIAGRTVRSVTDVLRGERRHAEGTHEAIDLPRSDVLVYETEGDARIIVRPSGTEPKLKCYYEIRAEIAEGESLEDAEGRLRRELFGLVQAHQKELEIS